jgi:hypothetical protein
MLLSLYMLLLSLILARCREYIIQLDMINRMIFDEKYRDADKSLARPGRKQVTATEDF